MTSLPTPRDIPVVASGVEHLCPGQVVITLYQNRPSSLDLLLGSSGGNVVRLVLPYAFLTFTERALLVVHPAVLRVIPQRNPKDVDRTDVFAFRSAVDPTSGPLWNRYLGICTIFHR